MIPAAATAHAGHATTLVAATDLLLPFSDTQHSSVGPDVDAAEPAAVQSVLMHDCALVVTSMILPWRTPGPGAWRDNDGAPRR